MQDDTDEWAVQCSSLMLQLLYLLRDVKLCRHLYRLRPNSCFTAIDSSGRFCSINIQQSTAPSARVSQAPRNA